MTRIPDSVRPDAIRLALANLTARIKELEAEQAAATVVTGWTDAQPRWVAYAVDYSDFATAATTVDYVVGSLPAGTIWTHAWIEPGTNFASPGLSTWRMGPLVPTNGATITGTPKTTDVTTPDTLSAQGAAWFVVSDPASAQDLTIEIDSGGGDNGNQLTAGTATVHLLLSVPGATSDDLPHG